MTVAEIISQYDEERPNDASVEMKIRWLRKLERLIYNEVILTHDDRYSGHPDTQLYVSTDGEKQYISNPMGKKTVYAKDEVLHFDAKRRPYTGINTEKFGLDTELIVPEPYDDIYIHYLDMRVAMLTSDTRKYTAAVTAYNNALITYQQYMNRMYRPRHERKPLLRHEVL